MAIDVFGFVWNVPQSGYQWIQARILHDKGLAKDREKWVLTDGLALHQPFLMKQYSPLKMYTGLFRNFAQLPADNRDAILDFANEYGALGIGKELELTAKDEPRRLLGVYGETWNDWWENTQVMRLAVDLWDMVTARDTAGVSRHIQWKDAEYGEDGRKKAETGWYYDSHPDLPREQVPSTGRTGAFIEPIPARPGDVLMPAASLVYRWINEHLKGTTTPRLVNAGKVVLQIVPENLLAAMWLQFAQSIAANKGYKDFRACKECGKWFELSHKQEDRRTVRREFCSDPCKSRDYRRRKERAQSLKAEGKPVKVIAKELDTDVETIKKWVAKRRG
jgi:hypothetical protein